MQNRLDQLKNNLGKRHEQQLSEEELDCVIALQDKLEAKKARNGGSLEGKHLTLSSTSRMMVSMVDGNLSLDLKIVKLKASAEKAYETVAESLKHNSHDAITAKLVKDETEVKNGEEISDFLENDNKQSSFRM
jgi:hypothetical protein